MHRINTLILGAGISGLTTAFALREQQTSFFLLETSSTSGGSIRSVREGEWLFEEGPNSALETNTHISGLLEQLGLASTKLTGNEHAKNRYILKYGSPIALPTSPIAFLRTPLFSTTSKLRLLKEPFIPPSNEPEETLASFVERRLGKEFLEYAINPFVGGIYAGDPRHLVVRHAFKKLYDLEQTYGSLIKGQIKGAKERKKRGEVSKQTAPMFSFVEGLQTLTDRLAERLKEHSSYAITLTSILKSKDNTGWEVEYVNNDKTYHIHASRLILTLPPHRYSTLPFEESVKSHFAPFKRMEFPPVSVVGLGFKRSDVDHALDGFGMLVPEKEERFMLGSLFNSSIFKHRAPKDHVLLTNFVGGVRSPEFAGLPQDFLVEHILKDLREVLGVKGTPVKIFHRFWPKAIPQYNEQYSELLQAKERIEALGGLRLTGNAFGGISMSDCITNGLNFR